MLSHLILSVLRRLLSRKVVQGERGARLLTADDAMGWIYLFICLYLCGLSARLKTRIILHRCVSSVSRSSVLPSSPLLNLCFILLSDIRSCAPAAPRYHRVCLNPLPLPPPPLHPLSPIFPASYLELRASACVVCACTRVCSWLSGSSLIHCSLLH